MSMTNKDKTNYTRLGLSMCGIGVDNQTAEVIWRTIEGIQKKKGKFSISDAVDIKVSVEKTYEVPDIDLPKLTVGGRQVELTDRQKELLRDTIKQRGRNSIDVQVLLMDFANQSRAELQKDGSIKQVNINKNEKKNK